MTNAQLKQIEKLLTENELLVGTALLRFRFATGAVIKDAIDSRNAHSIDGAASEISEHIRKTTGKTYGAGYWRVSFYSADKLSDADRDWLIKRAISITDLTAIVNKSESEIKSVMAAVRKGTFKGYKIKGQGRPPKKPRENERSDSSANVNLIAFRKPLTNDGLDDGILSLISEIKEHPELIFDDLDRAIKSAKQQLGIR